MRGMPIAAFRLYGSGLGTSVAVNKVQVYMKQTKSTPQADLLARLNCGPVKLSGDADALYERRLTFDQVLPLGSVTARDNFEAIARSLRDVLSQRWLKTEQTYQKQNPKRVYYLSL